MSKELPPSRKADQFVARFPDGLRDKLAVVAKEGGRSMNAEIVARLQTSFNPSDIDRVMELELALAREQNDKAELRERAALYANVLRLVADRLPPDAFDDSPAIAALLKDLAVDRKDKLIAALKQMVQDKLQTIAHLDHLVATGQIKIDK